jgi:nucleolar protein 4
MTVPESAPESKTIKTSKDGGTHTKATIFLRNLPHCTAADLESVFSEYGPVRSAFPIHKKDVTMTKEELANYKGIGFVHFALAEDAKKALEAISKGLIFMDRKIVGEQALRKGQQHENDKGEKSVKEVKPKPLEVQVEKTFKSSTLLLELVPKEPSPFDKKQLFKRVRKSGALKELVYPLENDGHLAKLIFENSYEATQAVARLDQHNFKGHVFKVTVDQSAVKKAHRLVIRNLPFITKVSKLQEFFKSIGTVEVTLPTKPGNDKQCRGFAFLQFESRNQAEQAIEFNGRDFSGRTIAIDWAVNKATFEKLQQTDVIGQEKTVMDEKEDRAFDGEVDVEGESEDELADEDVDVEADSDDDKDKESLTPESSGVSTVFIRNLSFGTEEDDLKTALTRFGQIEYCKIVRDAHGSPRGTAFVKFRLATAAEMACEASQALSQHQLEDSSVQANNSDSTLALEQSLATVEGRLGELARKRTGKEFRSSVLDTTTAIVVEDSECKDTAGIVVDGRALLLVPAVDKRQAEKLKKEGEFLDSGPQDRRNLYLLNETNIKSKSTAARKFWPTADITFREQVIRDRRKELRSNPNLFISKTRLAIRHLPTTVNEADIKRVLRMSMERALALKEGEEGYPLLDDKMLISLPTPYIKQCKVIMDVERNRSKGYSFAEIGQHAHALLALRYLNNIAPGLWRELVGEKFGKRSSGGAFRAKAPLIEFATEKSTVIAKRSQRLHSGQGGKIGDHGPSKRTKIERHK